MMLYMKLIIKLDKTGKYNPILIVKNIMEHYRHKPHCMRTSLHFDYLLKVPGVKNMGGGGWLDSLGSGILVGKRYFGVLQKY